MELVDCLFGLVCALLFADSGLYVHIICFMGIRYIGFVDNLWKSVVEKDSNSRSLSVFWFLSSLKYGILVMREIVPERKAG